MDGTRRVHDFLVLALLAVASTIVGGCASPICCRTDLSSSLEARLGCGPSPLKPPCDWLIPDFLELEDGLSEDEAIALGLWNNPGYQQLLADLQVAQSDVIQASLLQNPQMTTLFPLSAKQWEFALLVPLDAMVLRPPRVRVAELEFHRVAERLVQDGLNAVRDVRVAYADLAFAEQQLALAEQGERLRRDVARIAEARFKAGAVAELDVSAMRLDAAASKEQTVRAAGDVDFARERLRYLLGAALVDVEIRLEPSSVPDLHPLEVQQLVEEAIACRPDVRAVQLAIESAEEIAKLRAVDYLNIMGVLPDINSDGQKGFEAGPGLQMSLPIFNQNQGARARACAELERLQLQSINLRDTVAMEVRQSHARLRQSEEQLRIWRHDVLPQAQDAVDASRKALEEDGVALLLILENTRQLLTAQQREAEAAAGVRRAIAELERSVGRRVLSGRTGLPTRPEGDGSGDPSYDKSGDGSGDASYDKSGDGSGNPSYDESNIEEISP